MLNVARISVRTSFSTKTKPHKKEMCLKRWILKFFVFPKDEREKNNEPQVMLQNNTSQS